MKKITKMLLLIAAILMLGLTTIGTSVPTTSNIKYDFEMEQEEYVDDIPFDTGEVILKSSFEMEEEGYINDIPFDTEKIVKNLK